LRLYPNYVNGWAKWPPGFIAVGGDEERVGTCVCLVQKINGESLGICCQGRV